MLSLLVTLALSQQLGPCGPEGPIYCGGESFAFFEFAPASGRGMGAPCACTSPTGARGEALTFTRASSGTCLKAGTTSGIANGDMVTCASNQPRVMPGGDGTGGSGLLVEGARTNGAIRSEEITNAAWLTQSNAGALTLTADQAVSPLNATTAERLQVPATGAGAYAFVYQTGACTLSATVSGSWFVKGNGTSGTLDVIIYNGSAYVTAACAYNATTWTRCDKPNVATAGAGTEFGIGNGTLMNGGTTRSAADVFVWGAQCEVGAFASSYIATAGAAVTRARDAANFTGTSSVACESYEVNVPGFQTAGNQQHFGTVWWSGVDFFDHYINLNGASVQHFTYIAATTRQYTAATALTANAWNTVTARQNGTTMTTTINGVTTSNTPTAYTVPTGTWTLYPGNYSSNGFELGGVVRKIQLDPSSTRCR